MRLAGVVLVVMSACGSARAPVTANPTNTTSAKPQPAVAVIPDGICDRGRDIDSTSRFFAGRDASGAVKLYEVTPDANLMDAPNMYFDPSGTYVGNAAGGEMPDDAAVRQRILARDAEVRAGLTFEAVAYRCAVKPAA